MTPLTSIEQGARKKGLRDLRQLKAQLEDAYALYLGVVPADCQPCVSIRSAINEVNTAVQCEEGL